MTKITINYNNLTNFCKINNLKIITKEELLKENIYKNLVYSTKNNFVHKEVYPIDMPLIMNNIIWEKVKKLNNDLKQHNMCLMIYDAFRPIQIQQYFWDTFNKIYGYNDEDFVANPNKYGAHNITLNAIDIIPVSIDGTKLKLPCEFDDFSEKSNTNYKDSDIESLRNRDLLITLAKKNGLIVNKKEWWHYIDESLLKYNSNYLNTNLIPKELDKTFIKE